MNKNQHKLTIEPIGSHYRIVEVDDEYKRPIFEEYSQDIPLELMEKIVEILQEQYDIGYENGFEDGMEQMLLDKSYS